MRAECGVEEKQGLIWNLHLAHPVDESQIEDYARSSFSLLASSIGSSRDERKKAETVIRFSCLVLKCFLSFCDTELIRIKWKRSDL